MMRSLKSEDLIVQCTPSQSFSDPSKYLKDVDENDGFTSVLLKSQKKKNQEKG